MSGATVSAWPCLCGAPGIRAKSASNVLRKNLVHVAIGTSGCSFGVAFACGSQGGPVNGCHVNTSWGYLAPRWQRNLSIWASGGDQIQMNRAMWVVVACLLITEIRAFLIRFQQGPRSPRNCGSAQKGLRAAMRRSLVVSRKRRHRRRKKRPKTLGPRRRLVARDAVWIGGRRFAGRRSTGLMGCRCGPRQGGLGLYVLAAGAVEDMTSGAAWPEAGVSPRLWAALVRSVGENAARTLLELREGTQGPAKKHKTHRAKKVKEELNKSHRAKEAESPRTAASAPSRHAADSSPTGLPGDSHAPALPSHGGADEASIMPYDWVRTTTGWQLWGHFCRGGGGANSELLEGLQALLAKASVRRHKRHPRARARRRWAPALLPRRLHRQPMLPRARGRATRSCVIVTFSPPWRRSSRLRGRTRAICLVSCKRLCIVLSLAMARAELLGDLGHKSRASRRCKHGQQQAVKAASWQRPGKWNRVFASRSRQKTQQARSGPRS